MKALFNPNWHKEKNMKIEHTKKKEKKKSLVYYALLTAMPRHSATHRRQLKFFENFYFDFIF